MRQYNITMPKRTYRVISVAVRRNGDLIKLDDDDIMVMTVKKDCEDSYYKFRKSVGNGIRYNETTKLYDIEIESEDTKDCIVDIPYGYDITVFYGGNKPKQKAVGEFRVTKQYSEVIE